MKYIYLLTITIITFVSCKEDHFVTLSNDPNVNKIFNKKEINGLDLIVTYFDSIVVTNTKEHNINQAYHEYFTNIDTSESIEELMSHITIYNYMDSLINKLKGKDVFQDIWKYSYEYKSNDTTSIKLTINLQGKYFQLLYLMGKNIEFMENYTNSIQRTGYINPSLIAYVIKHYNNVDFQISVNRLIWAVHYITVLYKKPYIH